MAARAYWQLGGTCRELKRDEDCLPPFRQAVEEADAAEAVGSPRYDLEEGGRKRPVAVFYTRRGSAEIRAASGG